MRVGRRSQDDLNYARMAWEAERRKVERLDHQSFKSRAKREKHWRNRSPQIQDKGETQNTFKLIGQYYYRRMSDCRQ
jgi:hypothetical protein